MRLAERAGRCLRGGARLRGDSPDQQEPWDFAQIVLDNFEAEGWELRLDVFEDSVLALVFSSTPGAPDLVAVDVPYFGGSRGAEIATDWIDALHTLYWSREILKRMRQDMEAKR